MANHVKVAMVNAITTLKKLGWPKRRIARELGIDRETVTRYFELEQLDSKPATNAPIGSGAITGRSYRLKDRAGSDGSDKNKPQKDDGENTNEVSA